MSENYALETDINFVQDRTYTTFSHYLAYITRNIGIASYRGDILILSPSFGLSVSSKSNGISSLVSSDWILSFLNIELSTTFSSSIANFWPVNKHYKVLYHTWQLLTYTKQWISLYQLICFCLQTKNEIRRGTTVMRVKRPFTVRSPGNTALKQTYQLWAGPNWWRKCPTALFDSRLACRTRCITALKFSGWLAACYTILSFRVRTILKTLLYTVC
jgi:hypothetical protein